MSYWTLPYFLSDELRDECLRSGALVLPAEKVADLSRAQGPDQISEWLRILKPNTAPEVITAEADYLWRLGHELLIEDTIIVRTRSENAYLIGEITGHYRKEETTVGAAHLWPVTWTSPNVPASDLPALARYAGCTTLTEITDEHALISLRPHIAGLRRGNARFFRWLALVILVFELIYFWPRQ